jgi:flagellar assembly factor FliW
MRGGAVRLAVEAPQDTPVYRGELLEGLAPENERALLQRRLSTCPEPGLGDPLITFPYGLLGLGDHREFLLFDADDNLRLLVARDDPTLCLLLIDPLRVDPDYPVDRAVSRYPFGQEEVAVAAVLTRHADGSSPTVNLAAPLLIGMSSRRAIQTIFDDGKLSLRAPLQPRPPVELVRP